MKRILAATLALSLAGCQTTSYEQYAAAMVKVAEANASVAREQAAAMIALARDGGDQTARTVAILMLAMGAQGKSNGAQLQPPPNEALQWASILLPTVSTLALGWWGWKTNTAAINANSANTIASYEAISSFRQPIDFSAITNLRPNITNTTTNTNTLENRGNGAAVIGDGRADVDNSNRPVAIVPPVTVIPPVTIIPPVITSP